MAKFDAHLKCSFCGKSQEQVRKLIAGPGVYICDECIDLCNEILDEELVDGHSGTASGGGSGRGGGSGGGLRRSLGRQAGHARPDHQGRQKGGNTHVHFKYKQSIA